MKYLKHQLVERDSSQEVSLNKSFGEYAERLSLVNEKRGRHQGKRDREEARKDLPLGLATPSKPPPGRLQRAKEGIGRGIASTGRGVGREIAATGRGVGRGLAATGRGIGRGITSVEGALGKEGKLQTTHRKFRGVVDKLAYGPQKDADGETVRPNRQSMQTDPETGRKGMMDTRFETDDKGEYKTDAKGEYIPSTNPDDKTSRTAYDTEQPALRDRSKKTVLAKGVDSMADVAGAFESPLRREVYGSYGQNVPPPPVSKAGKKKKRSGGGDESEREGFDEVDDEGGR